MIRLEGFPGSSVQDIAEDMIDFANQVDLPVSLDMNGTHLLAMPGSNIKEIEKDYKQQLGASSC